MTMIFRHIDSWVNERVCMQEIRIVNFSLKHIAIGIGTHFPSRKKETLNINVISMFECVCVSHKPNVSTYYQLIFFYKPHTTAHHRQLSENEKKRKRSEEAKNGRKENDVHQKLSEAI